MEDARIHPFEREGMSTDIIAIAALGIIVVWLVGQ